VTDVSEVDESELARWVAATKAALDEADTVEGYLDRKRQARETIWLLASDEGRDVGTAIGIGGWHSPDGVARGEVGAWFVRLARNRAFGGPSCACSCASPTHRSRSVHDRHDNAEISPGTKNFPYYLPTSLPFL
jgi:hypothetical protein